MLMKIYRNNCALVYSSIQNGQHGWSCNLRFCCIIL